MAISLEVNKETCIKCGKCVRVCPAEIFVQERVGADVELNNIQGCIVCGHCAAACPAGAVIHGDFPVEKVHSFERSELPSAESMMLLCKARRSNRAFSKKQVPAEYINMILEAAHRAPTASNQQKVAFTVITDRAKLDAVISYTMDAFGSIYKMVSNPLVKPILRAVSPLMYGMLGKMKLMIERHSVGEDPILRGATALILIHTPHGSRFGRDDANLAYQNGSLMAECLGVSQFYTGFLCTAIRRDKKNKLASMLGIDGQIEVGMALGMPQFTYPNYIDRKDIVVTKFE